MTYITAIDCSPALAPQLSFVACVAVGEVLRPLLPPVNRVTYKWPNDVLLNGKKVAGILLEMIDLPEKKENAYLVACGLNIMSQPTEVRYPTTSLHNEGVYLSYDEILQGIVSSFQFYIELWKREGFQSILQLWMTWAAHIDMPIALDFQGKVHEGIFKGMDREGAMLLKTPSGLITIKTGEVLAEGPHASCN